MRASERPTHPSLAPPRVWLSVALSSLVLWTAGQLAAARVPGGFDWVYQVISALAARKHNPDGAPWFALGLALAMAAAWPAAEHLVRATRAAGRAGRYGARSLRAAIVLAGLVGLERLSFHHISDTLRKAHELVALSAFVAFYAGVLGLYLERARRRRAGAWLALLPVAPLLAVAASQLALYLDQRDLGWVGRDWRELGVEFWLSFAFWQWLAAAGLWIAFAHLALSTPAVRTGGPTPLNSAAAVDAGARRTTDRRARRASDSDA